MKIVAQGHTTREESVDDAYRAGRLQVGKPFRNMSAALEFNVPNGMGDK
jgi:hypothetical protein